MKRITAIMITLAMLAMSSCNGGTAEPGNTIVGTDVPDGPQETTVTEETTTEADPALPEFDINLEECLMYRLMDMTYEEIVAEFGEDHMVPGNVSSTGDAFYSLFLDNGTEIDITYYGSDGCYVSEDSWEIADEATPGSVSTQSSQLQVYPGISTSMTAAEVAQILPQWDLGKIWGNGYIHSYVYINDYTFVVAWDMESDLYGKISAELEGASYEESQIIQQKYADEFVKNMTMYSSKIHAISISYNKIT